jgi:hypothetical protein
VEDEIMSFVIIGLVIIAINAVYIGGVFLTAKNAGKSKKKK